MTGEDRRLAWADLINARDAGGLPAAAGRVRPAAFVRTDSLVRLTDAGREALLAHGVTTIVDLRAPSELAEWPNPLDGHPGFRNLPLIGDGDLDAGVRFDSAEEAYCWMVQRHAPRIAAIVRGIADAPPGGVLVHCAAGKDRTGIVAALVLSVAGVDREAIADDYALSAWWVERMLEDWLAAQPNPADHERLRRMNQARPEIILAMLADLDRRHGGVSGYLAGIGVEEEAQERLRRRLLE